MLHAKKLFRNAANLSTNTRNEVAWAVDEFHALVYQDLILSHLQLNKTLHKMRSYRIWRRPCRSRRIHSQKLKCLLPKTEALMACSPAT